MDSTALYYTFSTVAQTLAAGFAVLAAFVLYRLQGIELELTRANEVFGRFSSYMSVKQIWEILITVGFEELDRRMRGIEAERRVAFYSRNTLEPPSQAILLWWPIWQTTVLWLKVTLAMTVLDIALCFAFLPFTPGIAKYTLVSCGALTSVVLIGMLVLVSYARLILILLAPAKLSPLS